MALNGFDEKGTHIRVVRRCWTRPIVVCLGRRAQQGIQERKDHRLFPKFLACILCLRYRPNVYTKEALKYKIETCFSPFSRAVSSQLLAGWFCLMRLFMNPVSFIILPPTLVSCPHLQELSTLTRIIFLCCSLQERGKRKWRTKENSFLEDFYITFAIFPLGSTEPYHHLQLQGQLGTVVIRWVAIRGVLLLNILVNIYFNIEVSRLPVSKCRQFTTPCRLCC